MIHRYLVIPAIWGSMLLVGCEEKSSVPVTPAGGGASPSAPAAHTAAPASGIEDVAKQASEAAHDAAEQGVAAAESAVKSVEGMAEKAESAVARAQDYTKQAEELLAKVNEYIGNKQLAEAADALKRLDGISGNLSEGLKKQIEAAKAALEAARGVEGIKIPGL